VAGLMVAIKGQRDGTASAAGPFGGPQRPPGADPVDEPPPVFLGPLPRFEIKIGSVHDLPPLVGISARGEVEMAGRSGEIRTHDPQHPMLMRYQAALRSDRDGSADHRRRPRPMQPAASLDWSRLRPKKPWPKKAWRETLLPKRFSPKTSRPRRLCAP